MHTSPVQNALMDFDDRPEAAKRLEKARVERGFRTAREACNYFSWNYNSYAQHENGTRGIGRMANVYARAYRVSEAWLLTGEGEPGSARMARIVGLAGAGPDGSVLFATGDDDFGEVPAPIDTGLQTVALEVRGNSMHGLANDGWLIFYEERTEPRADYMGEPCVCWLKDGRVLVKIPQPTRDPGLFNLESVNAPTMRDVPVREMALVTEIKTRRAAQKYLRRNPDQAFTDVKMG